LKQDKDHLCACFTVHATAGLQVYYSRPAVSKFAVAFVPNCRNCRSGNLMLAKRLTGKGFELVCFDSPSTLVAKFSLEQLQFPNKTRRDHEAITRKKTTIRYKSDNCVQKRQGLLFSAFPGRMFVLQRSK